jgi:hypothetical protein
MNNYYRLILPLISLEHANEESLDLKIKIITT